MWLKRSSSRRIRIRTTATNGQSDISVVVVVIAATFIADANIIAEANTILAAIVIVAMATEAPTWIMIVVYRLCRY